jgi:DNA invertase Pin-like site-specific DNA recombinase
MTGHKTHSINLTSSNKPFRIAEEGAIKGDQKMIGIYSRVSSNKQDTAAQDHELKKWADGKEVQWYRDKFTGKTTERPGLQKLLKDCRTGAIDTVVVWRIDRLGRTALGLHKMFEEFRDLKINFISIRDGVNLETPSGRLIAGVLASVASFETEVRAERINAGLEVKRQNVAEGKDTWNVGRPKGSAHKMTDEVKKQLYKMLDEKENKSKISRVLKISRQTIYTAIKEREKA